MFYPFTYWESTRIKLLLRNRYKLQIGIVLIIFSGPHLMSLFMYKDETWVLSSVKQLLKSLDVLP
jgi:hypothetical protein